MKSIFNRGKALLLSNGFIVMLIILNAAVLFAAGFDISPQARQVAETIDSIITVLFMLEVYVKIKHYGQREYFADYWNQFDAILVALSVPTVVSFVFGLENLGIGVLIIFRLLRLFKMFRLLRFVPEIDRITGGVQRAVKSSVVIILGFMIYTFIVGILSHYLFRNASPEFFGNPLISLYSTFKIFTIEGWFEIPETIVAGYSTVAAIGTYVYFIAALFSGGIIGLSLVNSIFVEEMLTDNTNEIEEKIDELNAKIDALIAASTTSKK